MTEFEFAVLTLGTVFIIVFCVVSWRLIVRLREEAERAANDLEKTGQILERATKSIETFAESLKRDVATKDLILGSSNQTSAARLLVESSARLSDVASRQVADSANLIKAILEIQSGKHAMHDVVKNLQTGIDLLSQRSVSDQLSKYPRKIKFIAGREFSLQTPGQGWSHFPLVGRGERIAFSLVCERQECCNTKDGQRVLYLGPKYELPKGEEVSFDAQCIVDPRTEAKVERFFEALEVSGIIEKGEEAIREFFTKHHSEIIGIIGVKATVALGSGAPPIYLVGVIWVRHAIEEYIDALRKEKRDARATEYIRQLFFSNPYGIKDVGGPGHVHFGEWIRRQADESEDGSYLGGLTRWLDPQTNQFAWLCPNDAYEQISKYQLSSYPSAISSYPERRLAQTNPQNPA
jgi:hypothetical protein